MCYILALFKNNLGGIMIDFTIQKKPGSSRQGEAFVQNECHLAKRPAPPTTLTKPSRAWCSKARAQGFGVPSFPLSTAAAAPTGQCIGTNGTGESFLGALSPNTQGPDDAMLTLLEHGTDFQKEKFRKPLLNGEKRICYSMTEKAAGADATGMQTTAVLEGDEWVLNGEKWFSSSASVADIAVVMAKPTQTRVTNRHSTFIVELLNPGYEICATSKPCSRTVTWPQIGRQPL